MKTRHTMTAGLFVSVAIAAALFVVWAAQDVAIARDTPGSGEPTLDEVRRATERFRDVNVALAEGYIRDPFDL